MTGQANTEFPVGVAPNPWSGDLPEAASSEKNDPSFSCSSKDKEGFAMVDDTLCPYKPDSQTAPYTQPVLDFNTESQRENSNRKKKWCQEIPGLQNLFTHQKRLVGSVCNDPEQSYIIPVCSVPLTALHLIYILC